MGTQPLQVIKLIFNVQCRPEFNVTPWHTNGEAELQESKGSPVAVIFLEVLEAWLQLFCHGQGIFG